MSGDDMSMLLLAQPQQVVASLGCVGASADQEDVVKLRSSTPPPPPNNAQEPRSNANGSPHTPATPTPGPEVEQPTSSIPTSALSSKRCRQCRTCLRPALKQAGEQRKAERDALGIAKPIRRPGCPRDPKDHRPRKKSKAASRAYDQGTPISPTPPFRRLAAVRLSSVGAGFTSDATKKVACLWVECPECMGCMPARPIADLDDGEEESEDSVPEGFERLACNMCNTVVTQPSEVPLDGWVCCDECGKVRSVPTSSSRHDSQTPTCVSAALCECESGWWSKPLYAIDP
jgi:hypothetical protein